jgi:PAS domain-containing protein
VTEHQLGRSVPEALDDGWEIFHADARRYATEEWPLVRSITSGEEVVGEEYFNVLADGSRLIARCSSSPIYDDRGEIVAGVLVMEDVTGQRRWMSSSCITRACWTRSRTRSSPLIPNG